MSNKLQVYKSELLRSVVFQAKRDFIEEDKILAQLDAIWMSMSASERTEADDFARRVGRGDAMPALADLASTPLAVVFAKSIRLPGATMIVRTRCGQYGSTRDALESRAELLYA